MTIDTAIKVSADTELSADVCVVGSGAAGITIAHELAGTDLAVIVLEAGGAQPDLTAERELFSVDELEMPRLNPEPSRGRGLGGSTTLWFGRIAVLDPIDFERRGWVPGSGWPIARESLDPWLARAAEILRVPHFERMDRGWWTQNPTARAVQSVDGADIGVFLWSDGRLMGEEHRSLLDQSRNIRTLTDAAATELVPDANSRRIDAVVVTRPDGSKFTVRARVVVLAAGALENARLLLASTSRSEHGIGNERDQVGRYLMDHLRGEGLATASLEGAGQAAVDAVTYLGERTSTSEGTVQLRVQFSPDLQRRQQLLNSSLHLHLVSPEQANPGFQAAKRLSKRIRRAPTAEYGPLRQDIWRVTRNASVLAVLAAKKVTGRVRPTSLVFIDQMEQEPDAESRVTVDHRRRDRLGLPQLQTHWRVGESTYRSLRHMHELTARFLGSVGIDSFESEVLDSPGLVPELWDMKHPSGTTRMSSSPTTGVVDPTGLVFGTHNLYVTGSSVFPTVGHANPTLTIVALAAQLADHLKRESDRLR